MAKKKTGIRYDLNFKRGIVRRVLKGETKKAIFEDTGISMSAILDWTRELGDDEAAMLKSQRDRAAKARVLSADKRRGAKMVELPVKLSATAGGPTVTAASSLHLKQRIEDLVEEMTEHVDTLTQAIDYLGGVSAKM